MSILFIRLRNLRNQKGITAKEMAGILGLKTEAAYYKKESGLIKFSLIEAKIISEKLDMPIEEIFFNKKVAIKET